jgi:hypothetical protein
LAVLQQPASAINTSGCWPVLASIQSSIREQAHRIARLVADADRHAHLVIAIDCSLAVVALDPAVTAFEDMAVGVGEIGWTLGFGLPVALLGRVRSAIASGSL